MGRVTFLNNKSRENDLLANQPFQLKCENGEIISFDMGIASQIAEAYRLAAMQEYLFETYVDYRYNFEEMSYLAQHVLDVMDDSHLAEEYAIEHVLYEDEPAYLDEDARALAQYAVRGHGVEGTPSEHVSDSGRYFQFDNPEEREKFNPFRIEIDGEEQEISYREALRYYGAKKVDSYVREFVDTNAKYISVFEDVSARILESVDSIGGMNLTNAYVTGIDSEGYIGVQLDFENDEKDVWESWSLRGCFEDGYPQLLKEDGTLFLDDIRKMCHGMETYISRGKWPHELILENGRESGEFVAYVSNKAAEAEGVCGVIVPRQVYQLAIGDKIRDFMNSQAVCGNAFVAHHGNDVDELAYIGPVGLLNINVFGHLIGTVCAEKKGYWHVDVSDGMFDARTFDLESFKTYVGEML